MPHAEMVLVIPVISFTFLVMGWIVLQFRGYLKQREALLVSRAPPQEEAYNHLHRDAA